MAQSLVLQNVGGQLFTTTTATLTSPAATGSLFERLVSLHVPAGGPAAAGAAASYSGTGVSMAPTLADPRHQGSLFIDRDGSIFFYILNYLKDGGQLVPPSDLHTTQRLLREAQYYQLTGLIELLQQHEANLQQRQAQLEQATAEHQQLLQKIAVGTAQLMEYFTPKGIEYLDQNDEFDEMQGVAAAHCMLVHEMKNAVGDLLRAHFPEK